MGRALRVADNLEAGMIWLNSENVRHLPTPFGGTKASGIGRDGGDYSFDFYMETKNICLAKGHALHPETRRLIPFSRCGERALRGEGPPARLDQKL